MDSTTIGEASMPQFTALTQQQIEDTQEFQVWANSKKEEAKNYVYAAFGLAVNLEDLIVWRDDGGWPDPLGRANSHKIIVSNQKYRDAQEKTLGNYNIWRKLPMPLVTETPTEP